MEFSRRMIVIGALLILTGSGCVMWSSDAIALIPAFAGIILMIVALVMRRASIKVQSLTFLFLGAVLMVISTSAVPRLIGMIKGSELAFDPVSHASLYGRTTAIALQAILAVVAVTTSVRVYFRTASTEKKS